MAVYAWFLYIAAAFLAVNSMAVGATEHVCIEGYVMDTYCIERGQLLDNPSLNTLEDPQEHTLHCLADVAQCVNSGFEVLQDPGADSGKIYCRAFKLDSTGNTMALDLIKKTGSQSLGCKVCDSPGGNLKKGFRATVIGTVESLKVAAGSKYPPTLHVTSVKPGSAGCNASSTVVSQASCDAVAGAGALSGLVALHGSLMMTGWGLVLPAGVLVAHFYRYNDPQWFILHRAFQLFGVLLTLCGFIVAVTQFDVFAPGYNPTAKIHGSLGIFVMCCGLLQPINAFLRPHKLKETPGAETRPVKLTRRKQWEILHKGLGWSAIVVAVPTIIIGTQLAGSMSDAFVITYIAFVVLLLALVYFIISKTPKELQSITN